MKRGIGKINVVTEEVLGREVTVQREPLAGEGDFILLYRYGDAVDRWGELSAPALRLMIYFLLIHWRRDGKITFDKETRMDTVVAMECKLPTVYRLMRELKKYKLIERLGGVVYGVDRSIAEILTRRDLYFMTKKNKSDE